MSGPERGTPYEGAPPPASPRTAERRIALVIGNGRYAHAATLANPANDAKAVADSLVRLGFDVVTGIDLDLRAIGDVQGAFEDKLRANPEVALLFYAGHGLQVDGRNYLVPVDAQITQKAHLASRALLFNDVLEPMAQHAAASLIFLDACRDNPFARNLLRAFDPGIPRKATDPLPSTGPIRGGLARIDKIGGTFIAYATAPDMVAYDGQGANSPFTRALLRHVETPALSVGDMMIDVRNAVLEETGGRQEPWDQSALRSRFYFVPKVAEPPAAPGPAKLSAAAEEWVAIQSTTSLATLAVFKQRHPEPPWSDYADARAAELREADRQRQEAEDREWQQAAAAERAKPKPAPPVMPALAGNRQPPWTPWSKLGAGGAAVVGLLATWQPWQHLGQNQGADPKPPASSPAPAEPTPNATEEALKRVLRLQAVERSQAPPNAPRSHWDCEKAQPWCPELRVLPKGSYLRGSTDEADEQPVREVRIGYTLAVARYETTFELWDLCHAEQGCMSKPDTSWGRGKQPVQDVSWDEITGEFLPWLNRKHGLDKLPAAQQYRLPTEAEWEYAARGVTSPSALHTKYAWGNDIRPGGKAMANCDGCGSQWDNKQTAPVGSFPHAGNAFGLYDIHGNVWEWVQDCYVNNYSNAPTDGSSVAATGCSSRVLRGGSWGLSPRDLRAAFRNWTQPVIRSGVGFRLARTLNP